MIEWHTKPAPKMFQSLGKARVWVLWPCYVGTSTRRDTSGRSYLSRMGHGIAKKLGASFVDTACFGPVIQQRPEPPASITPLWEVIVNAVCRRGGSNSAKKKKVSLRRRQTKTDA